MKNQNPASTNRDVNPRDPHCPNCNQKDGQAKQSTQKNDHDNLYETLAQDAWFPDFYATQETQEEEEPYTDYNDNDMKIYRP